MYKKVWCMCRVVVLPIQPIAFLTFSLPSPWWHLELPVYSYRYVNKKPLPKTDYDWHWLSIIKRYQPYWREAVVGSKPSTSYTLHCGFPPCPVSIISLYSWLPITRTFKGNQKKVQVIKSSKKIAKSMVKNSFYCTVNILITFNCRNVKWKLKDTSRL